MAKIEFDILFDGEVRGLRHHRLSIAAFGPALTELQKALMRTAQAIIRREQAKRSGRFGRLPRQLDLELVGVTDGCARLHFAVTRKVDPRDSAVWLETLPQQALQELCEDIGKEAAGGDANEAARAYLNKLPDGLNRQRYVARVDGTTVAEVEFSSMEDIIAPDHLVGGLLRVEATLVGVGFEPGEPYVRVRVEGDDHDWSVQATQSQVDRAITLRGQLIHLAAVKGASPKAKYRLIWLRAQALEVPDGEGRLELINERWHRVMKRLAQ